MSLFQPLLTLGLLLPLPTSAQQSNEAECTNLTRSLAYNASVTQDMYGLNVDVLGAGPDVVINEYHSTTWQVTARIGPESLTGPVNSTSQNVTTTLWFDTGDKPQERLGGTMGMCHNVITPQVGGRWAWSKEVLERSLDDEGDCKNMLGEECVKALESHYLIEGRKVYDDDEQDCRVANNTIPQECEGMLEEAVSFGVAAFNASTGSDLWDMPTPEAEEYQNVTESEPLVCSGLNLTRSVGMRMPSQYTVDYDVAVNFPVVDIMTFWPKVGSWMLVNGRTGSRLMCLRPESVEDGSREVKSAKEVLDEMSAAARFGSGDYLKVGVAMILALALAS